MCNTSHTFSAQALRLEFDLYLKQKTDIFNGKVKISMGVDGVDHNNFRNNASVFCEAISNRLKSGKYYFSPFREVDISKDKRLTLSEAKSAGKVRTLSVATISDVLVQRLVYRVIYDVFESLFSSIPCTSFAYRKNFSPANAVRSIRKHIDDDYKHILDADIEKFFDNIPHTKLKEKTDKLLQNFPDIALLIYRFFSADKVPNNSYSRKGVSLFYYKKPQRINRIIGIPQGGILSGMLANLYLHELDDYIYNDISSEIDIKYVRYADDFVVLAKNSETIERAKELIRNKLASMELSLHTDESKTKLLNIENDILEFVGFEICKDRIRIKKSNVEVFKKRFRETLNNNQDIHSVKELITQLNKSVFRILGNEAFLFECINCGKSMMYRGWVAFFLTITDIGQLRNIDKWIRREIYYFGRSKLSEKFDPKLLRLFPRLETTYYRYKKTFRQKKTNFCDCPFSDQHFERNNIFSSLFISHRLNS